MDVRLPAHLVVSGIIRKAEVEGGFAVVVQRGEYESGVVLILTSERGQNVRLWERMPHLDGTRPYHCVKVEDIENKREFAEYLSRRRAQDPDCWLVDVDVLNSDRFIETMVT